MSKSARLKEKKKELNDAEKIEKGGGVLFNLSVTIDKNGNITVNGPINDPILVMKILAGAMNVVVDHNLSMATKPGPDSADKEDENGKIISIN